MSRVVIGQSVDLLHHQSVKISISQSPCLSVSKVTFNQPINLSVFRGLSLSKSNNLKGITPAAQSSQYIQWLTKSQSSRLSVSYSVSQSLSRSVSQSVSQSASQSIGQSVSQSVSHWVSQSVIQSVCQSVSLSVSHSVNQWLSPPVS